MSVRLAVVNGVSNSTDKISGNIPPVGCKKSSEAAWDRDASTVERARHHKGIGPSAGHAGLGAIEVLGIELAARKEAELHLHETQPLPDHDTPRRGPSLRR